MQDAFFALAKNSSLTTEDLDHIFHPSLDPSIRMGLLLQPKSNIFMGDIWFIYN